MAKGKGKGKGGRKGQHGSSGVPRFVHGILSKVEQLVSLAGDVVAAVRIEAGLVLPLVRLMLQSLTVDSLSPVFHSRAAGGWLTEMLQSFVSALSCDAAGKWNKMEDAQSLPSVQLLLTTKPSQAQASDCLTST